MPTLGLEFKGKRIKEYQLLKDRSVTIGRKESNDIVIANLGVSGNHARIDAVSDTFTLTDVESTNGTFVNKEIISSHILENGDVILIGKHELIFETSGLDGGVESFEREAEEKTLHLDTAEYRELIEKAKREAEKKKAD